MIGGRVGSYRILAEIGRGGMGVVYLAEHEVLARRAAVKVLHRVHSADPTLVDRFFVEARLTSALDHPGIVRVLDCGTERDGHVFIVMELLEGCSLGARLASAGKLPIREACSVAAQVAEALAAVHERRIVHRDLKPDNVLLLSSPAGAVKVVDFGVAKLIGDVVA